MTFLNAFLGLGAAAFTIPLVIHLLNRSKYQTLDWGAMQFLSSSVQVNARRIQWKQLLLLLVRCILPILLALAMARPMVLAWRDSGSANAMALAIMIDDSMSMHSLLDAGTAVPPGQLNRALSETTRLAKACAELESILGQLPSGSSACIILSGAPVEVWAEQDPDRIQERLRSLAKRREYSGPLDAAAGTRAAVEWLNQRSQSRRHLLVVSDFAAVDWESNPRALVRSVGELLPKPTIQIAWSFLDVSKEIVSERMASDFCVTSLEGVPSWVAPGGTLTLSASLQNRGPEAIQVPVRLTVGVEEIERQSLTIAPQSSATVRFSWTPKTAGDTEIGVTIDSLDATPHDNSIARVLTVQKPIQVLLVDGERRNEAMRSESDYLRVALTPIALMRGQPGDLFETRVVTANECSDALLASFQIVVCCNVPDLNNEQRQSMHRFATAGGGVVICLGDRIQVDRYNQWETSTAGGLRPGTLGPREDWAGSISPSINPMFELSSSVLDALSGVRYEHRNTLLIEDPTAWSGMNFTDGEPWLVSLPIGSGRCVWMLSSCDDGDSNLPARPAFVPIMQQLMRYASGDRAGWRSLRPGQIWQQAWTIPPDSSLGSLQVVAPNSKLLEIPVDTNGGSPLWLSDIPTSREVGVITASLGDQAHRMSVELSPAERIRELDRRLLSENQRMELANELGATSLEDAAGWLAQVRSQWSGRELWTWFWFGAMAMFLLEIGIQQSLAPKRRAGPSESVQPRSASPNQRGAA